MKIAVGITGATGVIYGIRLLEELRRHDVETHLILSEWAKKTVEIETDYSIKEIEGLAHCCYDNRNLCAAPASGSFRVSGMVIVPCSMKTLSALTHGYAETLIVRTADVMLKEKRRLILAPRETPLNPIHLENMLKLSRLGVTIMPPMPAFYHRPGKIEDLIDHFLARVLDQLDIENNLVQRWEGQE
ncbi:UbiX family flavin prenyltransferase [Candidatus Formimonas warabiya]|uniref:Flavin prenyltransferase UbiX n=1 Tax=Formimonas warabiya TaxID=1761012 RepID=A0A3G1KUW2_FORW1|nr:UbiX family flavin prenyltransferase [Candidatus Formimonas warabiya]ATW26239.1 hypothetical protein DCMF_17050 [Candidatus Formimonas warabiya]